MNITINNTQKNYYSKPLKTKTDNATTYNNTTDLTFKATKMKLKNPETLYKIGKKSSVLFAFLATLAIKPKKQKKTSPTEEIVQEENLTPGKKIKEDQKKIVEMAKKILEGYSGKTVTSEHPNAWVDKKGVQHMLEYDPLEKTLTVLEESSLNYARVKFNLDKKLISVNDTIYDTDGNVIEHARNTFDPITGEILVDIIRELPFTDYKHGVLYIDHNTKKVLRYETPSTIEKIDGSKHTVTYKNTGEIILSFDADEINQLATSSKEKVRSLIKNIDDKIRYGKYSDYNIYDARRAHNGTFEYKISKIFLYDKKQERITNEALNRAFAIYDKITYILKDDQNTELTATIMPNNTSSTSNGSEPVMQYEGKIDGKYVKSPGFYEFTTEIDNKLVTFYLDATCCTDIRDKENPNN